MQHHPEQLDVEIYLGNTTAQHSLRSSWRTSRLVVTPLKRDGQPITDNEMLPVTLQARPWFIQVAEVQAVIDAAIANGNKHIAQQLQPLVDNRTYRLD